MTTYEYIISIRDKATRNFAKVEQAGSRTYRNLIKRQNELQTNTNNLTGSVKRLFTAYVGFRALKGFFSIGSDMEQLSISFEVMLGSASKAKTMIEEITNMGAKTPYEKGDLLENAKLLLNFGVAQDKILGTLNMLGDVAGGNKEKLSGLTLAYSQMQSAGRLMGQDLLQMINAGFNPLKVISEQTGKSMGELKKQMEKGAISADMVTNAFVVATSEGGMFYQMMERQSQTVAGRWSTFMDTMKNTALNLYSRVEPMIKNFIENMMNAANWIQRNMDLIIEIALPVGAFIGLIWGLNKAVLALATMQPIISGITAFFALAKSIRSVADAQALFNLVFSMNPIGWVITGIAAFVAIMVVAWRKSEKFRGVIVGTWEALKSFTKLIKDAIIGHIKSMLEGFGKLGEAIKALFKGDWDTAKKAAKDGFKALSGVENMKKAANDAKKVGEAARKGYDKGVAMKPKGNGLAINNTAIAGAGNGLGLGGAGGSGLGDETAAISSMVSGSKPSIINISVGALNEGGITVKSETVDQGAGQIEDTLVGSLLRVLNMANSIR